MVAEVLEEQQLDSGGFLVLAVQNSGSIQQEEEQDASKIYWLMWTFVNWKIEEDSFDWVDREQWSDMLFVLARYVAHIVCDLETLQSSCEFR